MSIASLVMLSVFHVVFDFFLQDRETATNKSSKFSYLLGHLFYIYVGLSFYAVICGDYSVSQGFYFALGNSVLHGLIDWNIWKLYKFSVLKRFPSAGLDFKYYEDSWFYNTIAVDQLLHGLCYLAVHLLVKGVLS